MVAPLMAAPFLRHWYVKGAVPVAVTENVAALPTVTDWLAGCAVMAGLVTAGGGVGGGFGVVPLPLPPLSPPPQPTNTIQKKPRNNADRNRDQSWWLSFVCSESVLSKGMAWGVNE